MKTTHLIHLILGLCAASLTSASCADPDVYVPQPQFGGPQGVIEGTITYTGPLPCTEGGRIVGAAVVLGFDERKLPPPEGLGTTSASLAVVTGEALFSGVRGALTYSADGARACPEPGSRVTVSAPFSLAPLAAGVYEVRGFYDLDGDFNPAFKIANLPSRGDIGGGAIENAAEVLAGQAPAYRRIGVGKHQPDGSWTIGEDGFRVSGVAMTLGLSLDLERPVFYGKSVIDPLGKNTDPRRVTIPADLGLETYSQANPNATEESFVRWTFGAGVPEAEREAASARPFSFPLDAPSFMFTRQDANADGVLDAEDHVPDSTSVPSLYPLAMFQKLSDGDALTSQSDPTVILQGLTLFESSLIATVFTAPDMAEARDEVTIALRPAVVCLDADDPSGPATLVSTHLTDSKGAMLVTDPDATLRRLKQQLGRDVAIAVGCMPQGSYSANLIYGTGQAWTTPNEAGACQPSERLSADGSACGSRARLDSQATTLVIGPPSDPAYCEAHPVPDACLPRAQRSR